MPKIRLNPHPRDVIPRNIKIMLAARGMNQSDLADRLGVTRAQVSNWMTGRSGMTLERLDQIAELLHTTPAKLYSGDTAKYIEAEA